MTCKLDSILIGRDLSLQDSEFVECVVYDVQLFVKNCNDNSSKSVLVFPPVNNYRRFLIHKVVEEQSQDLSTFSIGQGHARRTVVCFKRHVIKKPGLQNDSEPVTSTMGVDHQHLDGSANNTALPQETATKRGKAIPAVGIYRPPAARKLEEQVLTTPVPAPVPEKPRSGKARRPDIQVYVPRAKRLEVNRNCSLGLSTDGRKAACSELSENKKNQRLTVSNIVISTCNSSSPPNNKRKPEHSKLLKQEDVIRASSDIHTEKKVRQEDVICASFDVHVEKKVKEDDVGCKTRMDVVILDPAVAYKEEEHNDTCVNALVTDSQHAQGKHKESSDNNYQSDVEPVITNTVGRPGDSGTPANVEPVITNTVGRPADSATPANVEPVSTNTEGRPGDSGTPANVEPVSTNTVGRPADSAIPANSEKKFWSDVLIISDPEPEDKHRQQEPSDVLIISGLQPSAATESSPTVCPKKPTPQQPETNIKKTEEQQVPLNLNPDECTWDMLFDDNGDCLDPRLMEELTSAVGSVTIEKPQSDYRSYQSRVEMMLSGNAEDEFAHVLEIYNFPPEFKTQDLCTVFSPYMKNGFEIKWVDDTHALGVFSSALIAAEVLAADHPFVKTRPLHQATPESRMKARRSAEFLQPYRARPETCAAMARRLVTGALGVRLRTSAEEREAERRLLREARERKRLAARQRDEAWEGTLMSNK